MFRTKRVAAERRNHTARAQNNRVVAKNFYCITIPDLERVINFDLKFGYIFLGSTLLRAILKGIIQGSPLSPGIADLVLMVLELKNATFSSVKQNDGSCVALDGWMTYGMP